MTQQDNVKTQDMFADTQFEGSVNTQQEDLIKELREKTRKVEELSLKIDELYQVNSSLEGMVSKVQRYNVDLYNQVISQFKLGEIDHVELRRKIADLNKQLEAFPRQNKNCIEYFEKYKLKYEELDSKFTQQQKTEDQITELL